MLSCVLEVLQFRETKDPKMAAGGIQLTNGVHSHRGSRVDRKRPTIFHSGGGVGRRKNKLGMAGVGQQGVQTEWGIFYSGKSPDLTYAKQTFSA